MCPSWASAICKVEITAFSGLGERIQNTAIEMVEAGTKKSFMGSFHGAIAKKIAYGTYLLRVSAPGFESTSRQLSLDQPDLSVRMQLAVAIECDGFSNISGSVTHAPHSTELWVKLVPVLGSGGIEERIHRDGSFLVSGLDVGDHFFLVVDRETILHTDVFLVAGSKHVNVDLGAR